MYSPPIFANLVVHYYLANELERNWQNKYFSEAVLYTQKRHAVKSTCRNSAWIITHFSALHTKSFCFLSFCIEHIAAKVTCNKVL